MHRLPPDWFCWDIAKNYLYHRHIHWQYQIQIFHSPVNILCRSTFIPPKTNISCSLLQHLSHTDTFSCRSLHLFTMRCCCKKGKFANFKVCCLKTHHKQNFNICGKIRKFHVGNIFLMICEKISLKKWNLTKWQRYEKRAFYLRRLL